MSDTIAVDVFKLPLTVASMLGWVVKFNLLRSEYGPAEKVAYATRFRLGYAHCLWRQAACNLSQAYLTRRAIGLSEAEWEVLPITPFVLALLLLKFAIVPPLNATRRRQRSKRRRTS